MSSPPNFVDSCESINPGVVTSTKVWQWLLFVDGHLSNEGVRFLVLAVYPEAIFTGCEDEIVKIKSASNVFTFLVNKRFSGDCFRAFRLIALSLRDICHWLDGSFTLIDKLPAYGLPQPTPYDDAEKSIQFKFFQCLVKIGTKLSQMPQQMILIKRFTQKQFLDVNPQSISGLPNLFIRLYRRRFIGINNTRPLYEVLRENQARQCLTYLHEYHESIRLLSDMDCSVTCISKKELSRNMQQSLKSNFGDSVLEEEEESDLLLSVGQPKTELKASPNKCQRDITSSKSCRVLLIKITCNILFTLVLLLAIIGLLLCSTWYGVFLSQLGSHDIIIHEGHTTFLAFQSPVDGQFYDSVSFRVQSLAYSESVSFDIFQVKCNKRSNLHKSLVQLNHSESAARTFSGLLNLFHFQDVVDYNDAVEASEYMLPGSTITITIGQLDTSESVNVSVKLLMFDDVTNCDRKFQDPTFSDSMDQVKLLSLDKANDSITFVVEEESYICGVWVIPVHVSLTYHVNTNIFRYNTSVYEESGTTSLTSCSVEGENINTCNIAIRRSNLQLNKRNMCFLVERNDASVADVMVKSVVHRTFKNAGFVFPFIAAGLITIVLCIMYIVCVVCVRRVRISKQKLSVSTTIQI